MTIAEWKRIKELFHAALQVPAAERDAFLARQPDAQAVVEEIEALLRTYDKEPEFLENVTPQLPPEVPEIAERFRAGSRIGHWELIREVGRGGMGIVWEARRADQQYEQRVAIKLLAANFVPEQVARFREERRILASFNHPGIARLLDGGMLEDGSPYLVMEYIEGAAIDEWCAREQLNLRARLKLFLSVCEAVEYAHRHLVIHRDLKPVNILVTPEGVPKLLDFGIAKLIDPAGGPAYPTTRLLTPEFASPEQLQGGVVTASSDVFSLGVLLYLLLTNKRPFAAAEGDTLGLMRAVCEDEPARPSTAAGDRGRDLRGELDAVVLQALRKQPDERYQSVHALADDIRAWLAGGAVSAAPQPWPGRFRKFVLRHKTQSAAVALAVVFLLTGSGVSVWQARIARQQRERAERRFREVRRFSRSVLFELHEAIRDLPGATAARNLLLKRATEFLDGLATDPAADTALKLELAQGYNSLGRVQGGGFNENLGNRDAATESFQKAARLGEQVLAGAPGNVDAGLVLLDAYDSLTRIFLEKHMQQEAGSWHGKHQALTAAMELRHPTDPRAGAALADAYSNQALYFAQLNDLARAKELYRHALKKYDELHERGVDSIPVRTQYAFASKRLGAILIVENSLDEAESRYRTALAMEDGMVTAAPGDANLRLNRTFTQSDLALILRRRNDFPAAAALYQEVLRTRRAALDSDPKNLRNLRLTATANEKLAGTYSALKRHREAIAVGREAIRLRDSASTLTHDYAERLDAAAARVILATLILTASRDPAFHPLPGEQLPDAAAALRQAAPMIPNPAPGRTLSRVEQSLRADYDNALIHLTGGR